MAMQSPPSDYLKEDQSKFITEELQKGWADTHCEVLLARLNQPMARVVKEVRDLNEGVRRQLDILRDIESKKYGDFRQQFRIIFGGRTRRGMDVSEEHLPNDVP